jgi:predicted Fe-Mo cluster-binding NifX family protein
MQIAVITEDGKTISKHFGRAPYYMILTVENGKIVKKEQRNKAGHHTFGDQPHAETAPGEKHGYDAASHSKHTTMAETMADAKLLIAGGMGWGAYDSLKSMGIETIITDVDDIDEAAKLYIEGKLTNLASERLH